MIESTGTLDLGLFLRKAEERCLRAGNLKQQLVRDKERMFRRWECLGYDMIVSDLMYWLENAKAWSGYSK